MYTAPEKAKLEAMLASAEQEEHIFHGKMVVIVYKLTNGFCVMGSGMSVTHERFAPERLRKMARENALGKLWQLEGYSYHNETKTDEHG